MKKYVEIAFAIIASSIITLCLTQKQSNIIDGGTPLSFNDPVCECSTESITDMYASYVDEWKKDISNAFDEAEIKVYNITPSPDIVGPNEDPDKCICKGTGVIKHGDGHTTSCPYHGSKFNQPLLILEK